MNADVIRPLARREANAYIIRRVGSEGFRMLPRVTGFVAVLAMLATAGHADARRRHHIDATPFSHEPCSVLSRRPCTPSFCSVFNRGPCIPEMDYPYGENLQLTVETLPPKDLSLIHI